MTVIQNENLADIFDRVKVWPLDMQTTPARRILETTEMRPSLNLPTRCRSMRSSAS